MIRPTLFLGIGSTGTRVLKYLRQLMFEEFINHAGLPIFRYVAIETDGDEDGTDKELRLSGQARAYEKIHVIHTVIPDTTVIESKLDPSSHEYSETLQSWLDPELLKIGVRAFKAGAANIRMAGRLCLWENWETVTTQLGLHFGAIIAEANKRTTRNILSEYFGRKQIQADGNLDLNNTPNVYLVGSLCGGTCSGMLIDLGYFLSTLFAAGDSGGPSVCGYFTTFDQSLAVPEASTIRAANCYGALYELNFYSHPNTTYKMSFPDGQTIGPVTDPPYDYTLFVSRTGRNPAVQFNKENGEYDEEGWNQMIAMDLFAEAVGGSGGLKNSIRVNWYSHPGYRTSKPPSEKYVRNMGSFGLTAVWYPKYRIATATACLTGRDLCQQWLKESTKTAEITHGASQDWNQLLETQFPILTSVKGQTPIPQDIDQELSRAGDKLLQCNSAQQLKTLMNQFPKPNDTFVRRFGESGTYFDLMRQQAPVFENALRDELWEIFKRKVSQLATDRDGTLDDIRQYFTAIDNRLEEQVNRCPAQPPRFNLQLNFAPMTEVERDNWMWLVRTQRRALTQYKRNLIGQYTNQVRDILRSVRNYFIRGVLDNLREEIGIGKPPKADAIQPRMTIASELRRIQGSLESVVAQFEKEHEEAINPPKRINVEIVAANPENRLDLDAQRLQRDVSVNTGLDNLLKRSRLSLYELLRTEDYVTPMKEVFRQEALEKIGTFNVITKAEELLGTGRAIQTLAEQSNPYQAFNPDYRPLPIPGGQNPKLIVGPSVIQGNLGNFAGNLANQGVSGWGVQVSHVDHLLLFYQEEAGFAMDDLAAFDIMKRRFDARPGKYGHLTHKDEMVYDLEYAKRVDLLQRWLSVLADGNILPAVWQTRPNAFANIFHPDPQNQQRLFYWGVYRHKQERLYLDGQGTEKFAHSNNIELYHTFVNTIRGEFHQIGPGPIQEIVNGILSGLGGDEFTKQNKRYDQFLKEVFDDSSRHTQSLGQGASQPPHGGGGQTGPSSDAQQPGGPGVGNFGPRHTQRPAGGVGQAEPSHSAQQPGRPNAGNFAPRHTQPPPEGEGDPGPSYNAPQPHPDTTTFSFGQTQPPPAGDVGGTNTFHPGQSTAPLGPGQPQSSPPEGGEQAGQPYNVQQPDPTATHAGTDQTTGTPNVEQQPPQQTSSQGSERDGTQQNDLIVGDVEETQDGQGDSTPTPGPSSDEASIHPNVGQASPGYGVQTDYPPPQTAPTDQRVRPETLSWNFGQTISQSQPSPQEPVEHATQVGNLRHSEEPERIGVEQDGIPAQGATGETSGERETPQEDVGVQSTPTPIEQSGDNQVDESSSPQVDDVFKIEDDDEDKKD